MREILFRGKPKDNGEWVEGCGIIATENWVSIFTVIDDIDENSSEVNEIEVLPETVGQYTGLTDKNGTKIFDGDVIQVDEIEDQNFVVAWNNDDAGIELADDGIYLPLFGTVSVQNIKVVGNIHDNPELLEVSE